MMVICQFHWWRKPGHPEVLLYFSATVLTAGPQLLDPSPLPLSRCGLDARTLPPASHPIQPYKKRAPCWSSRRGRDDGGAHVFCPSPSGRDHGLPADGGPARPAQTDLGRGPTGKQNFVYFHPPATWEDAMSTSWETVRVGKVVICVTCTTCGPHIDTATGCKGYGLGSICLGLHPSWHQGEIFDMRRRCGGDGGGGGGGGEPCGDPYVTPTIPTFCLCYNLSLQTGI